MVWRWLTHFLVGLRTVGAATLKVRFVNDGSEDLLLSWVDSAGRPELKETINPGMVATQDTFEGHVFQIATSNVAIPHFLVNVKGSGEVRCFLSTAPALQCTNSWTDSAATQYSGARWDRLVRKAKEDCSHMLAEHPLDLEHFCNTDPKRWHYMQCKLDFPKAEWRRRQEAEVQVGMGFVRSQPPQFVNFTDAGFAIRDAEDILGVQLLGELRSFWLSERLQKSHPENHPVIDSALSGCESNTWMLNLSPELKEKIYGAFRPAIASWIGVSPETLEPTAIYGIRLYRNGSLLNWHVDKRDTHAVSAILEIGHLGFGHPDNEWDQQEPAWPLMIVDHHGKEHAVPNSAGQAILYESATCPHGRPSPFPGREFANVFVHFRPKGWPEDFAAHRAEL
eukprot:TRINITY_DN102125_c0_g1_i1.p1 TRINITY_DN102125_c0_g1~~TRINITY_DN102125_c0_g1_i1.p1  ORF type:complete len:401 (-),score=63.58 TRINITY_DN102125_c0_g1_i1:118-1299(-)